MLLFEPSLLARRADVVAGPLAPLAASLATDLDRLLPDEDVFVPREKAKMTRHGGRCARDGLYLEFDPGSPRRHRCPGCGALYDDESHYRWWVMGYQLWLAERAVHAAVLSRLPGTERHGRLAESILLRLAERYLAYPDEDNVLGPTRVFFSTYLESIWLLQLAVAVSFLEDGVPSTLGHTVRDRIIEPSSQLIRSFNEGESNRQVWNSAALAAAGALLKRGDLTDLAFDGPGGLQQHLRSGLFADGTWYEGENYHLFAHRGLWYLVTFAHATGVSVPPDLLARFDRGFAAPLRTALPDFTFPARRDSQYHVALRQWRTAESLELGLARAPGARDLIAGLHTLYEDGEPGDAARWRSTAEAERNVPGVRLTRADLGWKSLLFAVPDLPAPTAPASPQSVLLPDQGFAIIRRDEGRTWAALDYGASGGSHGHPDRLNLWLVRDDRRFFEDVGTGSYVDPSLPWYRSTLAHNAPFVDQRSQVPTDGVLRAWDVQEGAAWVDAEAEIAPGVRVRRTVVVAEGHLVDRVEWSAPEEVRFALPMHIEGEIEGAAWITNPVRGSGALEDGFAFVTEGELARGIRTARVTSDGLHGVVHCADGADWERLLAPGPPGTGPRRFLVARSVGSEGIISSAWSWTGTIDSVVEPRGGVAVTVAGQRFLHVPAADSWRVERDGEVIVLGGRRTATPGSGATARALAPHEVTAISQLPKAPREIGDLTAAGSPAILFPLGEAHYRRTEATWTEAGSPTATIAIGATAEDILLEVTVNRRDAHFAAKVAENPLDNEHPDVNSDGVQIHLRYGGVNERPAGASWLLVPEAASRAVRLTVREGAGAIPLAASWRRIEGGWQLLARIPRAALGPPDAPFGLDVIVNEMPAGRERRRGQLVLSGGRSEWAYLRGDRQEAGRLLLLRVRDE